MESNCRRCEKEFEAESMMWAKNKRTGEIANGGGGGSYYGPELTDWPADEVEEYEIEVGGVGTVGLCPDCVEVILDARDRAAEYNTPCPPSWFDPSYAGERWSDDY